MCECVLAGICDKYKRRMSEKDWKICQGQDITPEKQKLYLDVWEARAKTMPEKPPILEQLKNAATSAINFAKGGFKLASQAVKKARVERCETCIKYFLPATRQCSKCGCFVDLKAAIEEEKCPHDEEDRWANLELKQDGDLPPTFHQGGGCGCGG